MPDYLPKFPTGGAVTFGVTADVTGGRLVAVTGGRLVGPAGADSVAIGVAAFDASAGDNVTVHLRPHGIHPIPASGAIAVGAKVAADTGGRIKDGTTSSNAIGIALSAATAAGDLVDVMWIGVRA